MIVLPKKIHAGASIRLVISDANFLPSAGWSVSMVLSNVSVAYTVAATDSDDTHIVAAGTAVTTLWAPGNYAIAILASNADERCVLAQSFIEVKPDLTTAADQRHHVQIVLDALEKMLEGKATKDHTEVTINGRTLKRMSPGDLLVWRDKYRADFQRLERAERAAAGVIVGRVGVSF